MRKILLVFLFTFSFIFTSQAQVTTASIKGVVGDIGTGVNNVSVTVTDTRTNTSATTKTGANGEYYIPNLKIGGPYNVSISGDGVDEETISDVFLEIGKTQKLDFSSEPVADEVIVMGQMRKTMDIAIGPASSYSTEDLRNLPGINKDIKDLAQIDSRLFYDKQNDSLSCMGMNNRFNSLTVDGVRMNDGFGLKSGGYPTEGMPFAYEAIEQFAVEFAPYDVEYNGFTSCNINAVSKSGRNEFFGTLRYDYTDDSLKGDSLEGDTVSVPTFEEKTMQIAIGGPIVQDKLFFFAAYEKDEGVDTFERGYEGSGAINELPGFTEAQFNRVRDAAINTYGYDPGNLPSGIDYEVEKILLKFDANLSDNHRATLTYNYTDDAHTYESDSDPDEFEFSQHLYEIGDELESVNLAIFSDWTDNFSTEFRYGTLELDNSQECLDGKTFGEMDIQIGSNSIYIGCDDSRHANSMAYEIDTLKIKGELSLGNHVITAGYEIEDYEASNVFVQSFFGEYEFTSLENFENQIADEIVYGNAPSGTLSDAEVNFGYKISSFYLQDEFSIMQGKLDVTAGIRYDYYESGDLPTLNTDYADTFGRSNAINLDGKDIVLPRLGLNYEHDERTSLRGGIGVFSGGNPNVWLSNIYSGDHMSKLELALDDDSLVYGSSGINLAALQYDGTCPSGLDTACPGYLVPSLLTGDLASGAPKYEMVALDPNYEIPSELKFSFGVTHIANLPVEGFFAGDYELSFDYIKSDGEDSAGYIRKDLTLGTDRVAGIVPQLEEITPAVAGSDVKGTLELTNLQGNDTETMTFGVAKDHGNGFDWKFSYTHMDSQDTGPMLSSVGFTSFDRRTYSHANEDVLSRSNFEIEDRVTFVANFEKEFATDYLTKFSLLATHQSGRPYSLVFEGNNMTGYTPYQDEAATLLYIPTGANDPNVVFDPGFDQTGFFNFLAATGANQYAGGLAPRNAFDDSPDWAKIDIKIEQELPGLRPGDKSAVFLVVDNLGNLLNDEWGIFSRPSERATLYTVDASTNSDGQFVFEEFNNPNRFSRDGNASLWSIRIGIRYDF